VRIRVHAAGINPGEAAIRQGAMQERFPAEFPSGQGSDLAGVVDAVGDEVDGVAVGDEVIGWSEQRSSQAELVVVPAGQVVPKPQESPWEVAGALYVVGVTARVAVDTVDAGSGDTVAVSAAAGGVGSLVTQLLRLRGATVIAISSSRHHDWLSSKGAVPVEYGDGLADRIGEAAPRGADAFIDTFGDGYLDLAVELGVAPDRIETIIAFDDAGRIGARAEGSQSSDDPAQLLREVADLVARGELEVPVAATYPLEQVQAAYEELEQRHTRGKIVLLP
jgi:NADPH:quinone reductase-like Zn-dependent oxidoreductase